MNKNNTKWEITEGNIFTDLGLDQPEELLARAKLLMEVSKLIRASKLAQQEVAKKLGISQPKVSHLMRGQLASFSTETLLHYLSILGCEIQIKVKRPKSKSAIFRRRGHIAVS